MRLNDAEGLVKDNRAGFSASRGPRRIRTSVVYAVLITKCPIRNLLAKKALMLYNEVELKQD